MQITRPIYRKSLQIGQIHYGFLLDGNRKEKYTITSDLYLKSKRYKHIQKGREAL